MTLKLVEAGLESSGGMSWRWISMWVVGVGMVYTKFMSFLNIWVWIYCIHMSKVKNAN